MFPVDWSVIVNEPTFRNLAEQFVERAWQHKKRVVIFYWSDDSASLGERCAERDQSRRPAGRIYTMLGEKCQHYPLKTETDAGGLKICLFIGPKRPEAPQG